MSAKARSTSIRVNLKHIFPTGSGLPRSDDFETRRSTAIVQVSQSHALGWKYVFSNLPWSMWTGPWRKPLPACNLRTCFVLESVSCIACRRIHSFTQWTFNLGLNSQMFQLGRLRFQLYTHQCMSAKRKKNSAHFTVQPKLHFQIYPCRNGSLRVRKAWFSYKSESVVPEDRDDHMQ